MTTASTGSALTSTLANSTASAPNVKIESAASSKLTASPAPFDETTANGFNTAPTTSEEDNLDYESEDDDDSKSNYSINNNTTNSNNTSNISTLTNGSSRGGRQYGRHSGLKGEETKRSHHNVLERKRRDLLKDSFTKLRDSVLTSQPKERVSRAEILKQAADFIQMRVQKNASVKAELDELIRKNQELEQKHKLTTTLASDGGACLSGMTNSKEPKQPTCKRER